jgi:hypothetical protein
MTYIIPKLAECFLEGGAGFSVTCGSASDRKISVSCLSDPLIVRGTGTIRDNCV